AISSLPPPFACCFLILICRFFSELGLLRGPICYLCFKAVDLVEKKRDCVTFEICSIRPHIFWLLFAVGTGFAVLIPHACLNGDCLQFTMSTDFDKSDQSAWGPARQSLFTSLIPRTGASDMAPGTLSIRCH